MGFSQNKPSHKRISYKQGKTESLVLERDLSNATYKIIHYKNESGLGTTYIKNSTKEATEFFNELLKKIN